MGGRLHDLPLDMRAHLTVFLFLFFVTVQCIHAHLTDYSKCEITGPGILPHDIVLPARYFFIKSTDKCKVNKEDLNVELKGNSQFGSCRIWTQILDRHDGSFIVRYKMMHSCDDLEIHITSKGQHLGESPYKFNDRIYAETCDCPVKDLDEMISLYQCPKKYRSNQS